MGCLRGAWRWTCLGIWLTSWTIPAGASAQRMDLALSRLRVAAEDPATHPEGSCVSEIPGQFCADAPAFRAVASQFASALIPSVLMPAHTRGMRGIHVGVESSITGISSGRDDWARATEGDIPGESRNRFVDSVLAWNRLNVRKGLPFGFEIGGSAGFLVNTSYWSLGLDVRWALFEGFRAQGSSFYFPSVSVRGAVQTLLGEPELNVTVPSLDLSVGERFIIADTVEISPYVGAQLAWIFADTELVDLTPERDAFTECDPDPMPVGASFSCRSGDGSDFNNDSVFPSLRSLRARMFFGAQVRYEWFALTSAFSFDLVKPRELDETLPNLPRQWRVDLGLGVSY